MTDDKQSDKTNAGDENAAGHESADSQTDSMREDMSGDSSADDRWAPPDSDELDSDADADRPAQDGATVGDDRVTVEEDQFGASEEFAETIDEVDAADEASAEVATSEQVPAKPQKVKTGRGVAWFSFLIALCSLGAAGYLYYETLHKDPLAPVTQAMQANDEQLVGLQTRMEQSLSEQENALRTAITEQQQALEETQGNLIKSLNNVVAAAPPSEKQWKIAEAEYLLRIANHRILMEGDVKGSLQLLTTADGILKELDDFGFHAVRAQLAEEMLSLKNLPNQDLEGLFLRLEAVKAQLEELPLKVPEYLQAKVVDVEERPANLWADLSERLSGYLQIRRLDTKVKPLLTPDEAIYLEQNLRLMLERAQLAALKKHQAVYEESLLSTQDWLQSYLDPEDPRVVSLTAELDELIAIQLSTELPDISGSLTTLVNTQRGAS